MKPAKPSPRELLKKLSKILAQLGVEHGLNTEKLEATCLVVKTTDEKDAVAADFIISTFYNEQRENHVVQYGVLLRGQCVQSSEIEPLETPSIES